MSKKVEKLDRQAAFDFDGAVERYVQAREDVLAAPERVSERPYESAGKAARALAEVIKGALSRAYLSREQAVDRINEYFGGDQLSNHMMNHYLSKPEKYPLPAIYLFPLMEILGTREILGLFTEPFGARVIDGEEVRAMHLGQLDQAISEMQRLKKELRANR